MADRPAENKRYYFYRDQLVLLGIGFAIASVIIFVLGIMAGRQLERHATPQPSSSAVKLPVTPVPSEPLPQIHDGDTRSADSTVSLDHAVESESQPQKETKAKEKAARAERGKPSPAGKADSREPQTPATKSTDEKRAAAALHEQPQKTQTAKPAAAERAWSVQIKSSPDKKFADNWVSRLKAKGYDAFVVEGDVKGQTWYRVRVGRFAAKQEAEELRAALESKEGLSGGFLTMTNGEKTEVGGQKSDVRNTEIKNQKSEAGKTEVGDQKSEVKGE